MLGKQADHARKVVKCFLRGRFVCVAVIATFSKEVDEVAFALLCWRERHNLPENPRHKGTHADENRAPRAWKLIESQKEERTMRDDYPKKKTTRRGISCKA